ncbi:MULTISPECIES: alpha/beta hydrolase [unclassified Corallococcus]|uniref:alpha/beta hydrolase n=1 Tax=unclassified Corallococcus TaxID=2685029 RepID=UPI001A8FEE44|nr:MULTISPECIES: alpha/beta hydrolase [unclassified Corallococcus]MBN9682317.1 alpha/beta hydrolase [Corallococcus sp. NCSPR001]WAS86127.1 alpha/beta hydrolase [Corallococcus sp. NCRR]
MSTRHLVDPSLLPLIAYPFLPGLSRENLADGRTFMDQMIASIAPRNTALRSEVRIPGLHGAPDVRLVIQTPPGQSTAPRPAVLFLHGGGMVMGTAAMGEGFDAELALSHNTVVVSVDYRLAPEVPFPGPIDDAYAALRWVHANAASLGIDPSRIVLMGQSAGGGLAASLAQLTRDDNGPRPAAQILIYPMLDARTGTALEVDPNPTTGEFSWTRAHTRFGWESLRGDYVPTDFRAGHFSASLGQDVSHLPPAFIAVGSLDVFFDESMDYARRLSRAGVPVELHVYPGAIHGFDAIPNAWMSMSFKRELNDALTRALRAPTELTS